MLAYNGKEYKSFRKHHVRIIIYKTKGGVKCPKKKLKAYKELFIKKGAPKTCNFE